MDNSCSFICSEYDKTTLINSSVPGISYPYEVPKNPDIHINTENISVEESVKKIMDFLLLGRFI